MARREPIGMFDSGLGGLSVLRELVRVLPDEDVIYVADSAHVPYGSKPPAFIRERSRVITRFLLEQCHVRALVVACNTATTHAVEALRREFPGVPIVGMEPALKPAAAATRSGVVGVLATPATLGGARFIDLAHRYADGVELLTQPSPGLVEQVEAGEVDGPETERLLRMYTEPMLARGADTIVLGCTHYPFLRGALRRLVGEQVALIDTGAAVAKQTARVLGREAASPDAVSARGQVSYYTSGDVDAARRVIAMLMDGPVERVRRLPV